MLLLATIMAFFALVMRIVAIEFRLSTLEAFFRKFVVVNNSQPSQPTPPKTELSGTQKFPPVAEEAHSDVSADDLSEVGDEVKMKENSDPLAARRDIERAFSDDDNTPSDDEEGPPVAPEAQPTRSSRRRAP